MPCHALILYPQACMQLPVTLYAYWSQLHGASSDIPKAACELLLASQIVAKAAQRLSLHSSSTDHMRLHVPSYLHSTAVPLKLVQETADVSPPVHESDVLPPFTAYTPRMVELKIRDTTQPPGKAMCGHGSHRQVSVHKNKHHNSMQSLYCSCACKTFMRQQDR